MNTRFLPNQYQRSCVNTSLKPSCPQQRNCDSFVEHVIRSVRNSVQGLPKLIHKHDRPCVVAVFLVDKGHKDASVDEDAHFFRCSVLVEPYRIRSISRELVTTPQSEINPMILAKSLSESGSFGPKVSVTKLSPRESASSRSVPKSCSWVTFLPEDSVTIARSRSSFSLSSSRTLTVVPM